MTPGILYGISLGTGAPDLLTLRADRLLRAAQRIYYAATPAKRAKAAGSYALEILRDRDFAEGVLCPLHIEMSLDLRVAQASYEEAFARMRADCLAGLRVAFVCEGDISFYSSFGRLLKLATEEGLRCEMVPGVSSFLHLCSEEKRLLAAGRERVAIVPLLADREELRGLMRQFDVIVLIKIREALAQVAAELEDAGWTVVLGSLLGSERQEIATGAAALGRESLPYLSLMILRKQNT